MKKPEHQDKLESEILDLLIEEIDQGNIVTNGDFPEGHPRHGCAVQKEISNDMISRLARRIMKREQIARLDEQNHLGFDKRLDNPILYCEDGNNISQEERVANLSISK